MNSLAHKIKLDPKPDQEVMFRKSCGCARFTYNWALAEYKRLKELGVPKVSMNDIKKEFNRIKKEQFPWIYESPKDANQQAFAYLKANLNRFYTGKKDKKKVGFPKFKNKDMHNSFYLSNDKFRVEDNFAYLPLIGKVKMFEPLRFAGRVLSGVVSKEADGWYLSISVDLGENYERVVPCIDQCPVIGIDFGLNHFATLSNGEVIDAPKPLKTNLKKLERYLRVLSRRKKGSKNRLKQKNKVAKLHQHISRVRKDFIHNVTAHVMRISKVVVIEDLNVAGMVKNHKLARSIMDVSPSEFRRQLEYKSKLYRNEVVVAGRFYPSSKRCSCCGHVKTKLGLNERLYICESCGVVIDRDLNASYNLVCWWHRNQLGTASAEVTLEEIQALVSASAETKLGSMNQEFCNEHKCSS